MVEGLIPEDVQAFLLKRIDSIPQLEALVLLRANPEFEWSAATLARLLAYGLIIVAIVDKNRTQGTL